MKSIINEYKKFALKGNVLDMAIGIVVGGAFATIASSLVDNIIAPILGLLTSGVDLADLFIVLKGGETGGSYHTLQQANGDGAVTLSYGVFLNSIFSFLIVTWFAFLLVKGINHVRQKEEAMEEKQSKECGLCFSAIDKRATRCAFCGSEQEKTG
jgi:large conductance mechanosensitive channel